MGSSRFSYSFVAGKLDSLGALSLSSSLCYRVIGFYPHPHHHLVFSGPEALR